MTSVNNLFRAFMMFMAFAVLMLSSQIASAQISVTICCGAFLPNGSSDIVITNDSTGGQSVTVTVGGNPGGSVFVEATSPGARLNNLTITPNNGAQIQVVVQGRSGTAGNYSFIGGISQGNPNGAVLLQEAVALGTNGVIGNPSAPEAHAFNVTAIRNVRSATGIGARFTANSFVNSSNILVAQGNITKIEAISGNITGAINAKHDILSVVASGTVGTSDSFASITAGSSIQTVQATSIFANMHGYNDSTAPVPYVARINATAGDFSGSMYITDLLGGTVGIANIQTFGNLRASNRMARALR